MGWELRTRRGEDAPNASLDNRTAREIRDRYEQGGVTMQRLADDYGVTKQTISNVVRGLRYGGS